MIMSAKVLVSGLLALSPPVVIDERFDDWGAGDLVATDPAGDSASGVGAFDLGRVWARGAGSELFLSFEMGGELRNLQEGLSFLDGVVSIRIEADDGSAIVVFLRGREVWRLGAGGVPLERLPWPAVDFALLPTVASGRYEMRVNLGAIGVGEGDQVGVQFDVPTYDGPLEGGPENLYFARTVADEVDALAAPAVVTMGAPAAAPEPLVLDRPAGTDLRIMSINTLESGLFDPPDYDEFSRMFCAMDADIYMFQEQNGTPEQIEFIINDITAGCGIAGGWTAVTDPSNNRFGSDFIVSRLPVRQVNDPPFTDDYAAAVVGNDAASSVLVLSIHPKCCGFIGNTDDNTRIDQTRAMVDFLARFRAGKVGAEFVGFAGVPVVVAGDWNLVGSDEPRRMLTDPGMTPSLDHQILLRPDGRDATTWRNLGGFSFAPGLLDLVAFSPQNLRVLNGFLLDTERMDPGVRAVLGLQEADSRVSDHLGMVIDVGFPASIADIDGNGVLNFPDVLAFLELFFEGASGADLDGPDGDRDFNDLIAFLDAFAAGIE